MYFFFSSFHLKKIVFWYYDLFLKARHCTTDWNWFPLSPCHFLTLHKTQVSQAMCSCNRDWYILRNSQWRTGSWFSWIFPERLNARKLMHLSVIHFRQGFELHMHLIYILNRRVIWKMGSWLNWIWRIYIRFVIFLRFTGYDICYFSWVLRVKFVVTFWDIFIRIYLENVDQINLHVIDRDEINNPKSKCENNLVEK